MKTAAEWVEARENPQGAYWNRMPHEWVRAIQADALEAAAEAAREFLTGMLSKEVTRAIIQLKPASPASPAAVRPK